MPNELPTDYNEWNDYVGPNGVPRISISPPAAVQADPLNLNSDPAIQAYQAKLPIKDVPKPTTYIMEPDLIEAQTGKASLPPDVTFDDAGFAYNKVTGDPIKIIRRPNVLPIARTPDGGFTFAMPKMLDLVGNVMGNVAAPAVATKAGEVVLGSGAVRKVAENPFTVDAFHGTNQPIEKFIKAKSKLTDESATRSATSDLGTWFTDTPKIAENYADNAAKNLIPDYTAHKKEYARLQKEVERTERIKDWDANEKAVMALEQHELGAIQEAPYGQNIMPVKLALKKPLEIDAKGGTMHDVEKANGDVRKLIQKAKSDGYDGVVFKNLVDNPSLSQSDAGTHFVVFEPKNIRSKFAKFDPDKYDKSGLLLSDTRNQVYAQAGHELEKRGPFYSALSQAVDNAKIGKASPEQWLGYLKNQPGVKSEEIATVLKDLPEGQITKSEMQGIVQNNKVQLGEVVKGGSKNKTKDELIEDQMDMGATRQEAEEIANEQYAPSVTNPTKYHSYQLPGGEPGSYKEMLLTLPEKGPYGQKAADAYNQYQQELFKKYGNGIRNKATSEEITKLDDLDNRSIQKDPSYRSSHWDEPNIIAHIRHNDRIVDGKKTLHLEEIQSDWHQKGRAEGYKLSDKQRKDLDNIESKLTSNLTEAEIGNPDIDNVLKVAVDKKIISPDEARNYKDYVKGENSTVPDAPFKKNWDELALKRMLHKAANEGYEGISWTPGEAQAARYDLSKQVDKIAVPMVNENGTRSVRIDAKGNSFPFKLMVDKNGIVEGHGAHSTQFDGKPLSDVVGKEMADKILKLDKPNEYSGEDLKIGGEGMKSFYDKMLVDKASSLIKKYGGKVEKKNVNGVEIPYIKLTPELKEKAKAGFPLFSSVPITVPVSHNPFASEEKKSYTLVPVNGNPFQ